MYKKIFIFTVLGIGLFFASPVFANDNLIVEFEDDPLFNEANFLPGENITRWVKATNNSGESQRIAAEAINVSDPNRLGDVLNLEIKEGGTRLYNGALSQFFNAGEVYLSVLAGSGTQTQYDFTVNFYSGANNTFQGKILGFDILIGFQGTEGGLTPGGGGGGGGVLPPGLTIKDEAIVEVRETTVTITWLTSYFSSSQVIYAKGGEPHTLDLTDDTGTPPKYGYAHTTPEYDVSPKVSFHSVTISGLSPETKYYFRCVSHASLAVSQEHSFTTLGVKEIGKIEEEEEIPIPIEEVTPLIEAEEEIEGDREGEEVISEEAGQVTEIGGEELAEEEIAKEEEKKTEADLGKLLAAVGGFFNLRNVCLVLIFLIIIAIILFLLSRKKKRKEE